MDERPEPLADQREERVLDPGERPVRPTCRAGSWRATCGEPCRRRRREARARPASSTRHVGERRRPQARPRRASRGGRRARTELRSATPAARASSPAGPSYPDTTSTTVPAAGAAAEQLDLDLADPAADLDDRRAVEPALLRPVGDPLGVVATETLAQVPPQLPSRPLLPEDVERLTGAAGARHDASMPARRRRERRRRGEAETRSTPLVVRPAGCGPRGPRRAPRAPASSSIRSSTSWKKPRTISRSASERGRPRAIR